MSTDLLLQFWHSHINSIIGFLVVAFFILVGLFLFLEFIKEKNKPESSSTGNLPDLEQFEKSVQKILNQAGNTATVAVPIKGGEVDKQQESTTRAEVETLQKKIAEKENVIQKLEDAKSEEGEPADDSGLKDKITELESKLLEYEIIEDDIADLSSFKDENLRLKKELEDLKANGASAEVTPEVKSEEEAKEETSEEISEEASEEDVSEEVNNLLGEIEAEEASEPESEVEPESVAEEPKIEEPAVVEKTAEEPVEKSAEEIPDAVEPEADQMTDDIMAEFMDAVSGQDNIKLVDKGEVSADVDVDVNSAIDAIEASESEEESPSASPAEEAGVIDAPEENAAEAAVKAADVASEEKKAMDVNTDKMLGEISDLNAMTSDEDQSADVLDAAVDTDKMIDEVGDLDEGSGKEQEQLVNEFSDFLKDT